MRGRLHLYLLATRPDRAMSVEVRPQFVYERVSGVSVAPRLPPAWRYLSKFLSETTDPSRASRYLGTPRSPTWRRNLGNGAQLRQKAMTLPNEASSILQMTISAAKIATAPLQPAIVRQTVLERSGSGPSRAHRKRKPDARPPSQTAGLNRPFKAKQLCSPSSLEPARLPPARR